MGFGGKIGTQHNIWTELTSMWWDAGPPRTNQNISLAISGIKIDNPTENYIENKVRGMSNKLANAYILESALL